MTKNIIPDGNDIYTDDDFRTTRDRFDAARDRVLADPKAANASKNLADEIAARVDAKRATLAQVRRAVGLTQEQLAETLGVNQAQVSKIERTSNLHLATLIRFIAATGGRLRIVAEYGSTTVDLAVADIALDDEAAADLVDV